jgi:UDP-glucose 4-epimerase
MQVFLTGGTGFIGSYIAIELLNSGHQVTILARNPNKVPALKQLGGLQIVRGDLTDRDLLEKLVEGKDACIHVALNYTKQTGWEVLLDDTLPTVALADAATRAQVQHFIYTSSTSANDSLYMGPEADREPIRLVTGATKQHPATFYGATKAASENYLVAQSHLSPMRINIIRPGYTFGNPVVEGGSIQADRRFHDLVKAALRHEPISVVKHDGTQFIWGGDLAKLYLEVLHSKVNRKTYFGLSKRFVSWESIAREAMRRCHSQSQLTVEDRGWSEEGVVWDVSDMQADFGLEFDPWQRIQQHLDYYLYLERKTEEPE